METKLKLKERIKMNKQNKLPMTVLTEYKDQKTMVTLTRNNLIERPVMYVGGFVKGVWYKKINKKLIVNFELFNENKDRFILFDVENKFNEWNDYLINESIVNSYFKDLLIV